MVALLTVEQNATIGLDKVHTPGAFYILYSSFVVYYEIGPCNDQRSAPDQLCISS